MPTNLDHQSIYDRFARRYDKSSFILDHLGLARLRRKLITRAQGKVLEVGIGSGRNLFLYKQECEITGIDISAEMLKIAESRARKIGQKVTLYRMDTKDMEFSDQSFDTVVSTLALCTYAHPLFALKEMRRVCKHNGKLFFLEHGCSSNRVISWFQNILAPYHLKQFGCHLTYKPDALIKKANLPILELKRHMCGIIYLIVSLRGEA